MKILIASMILAMTWGCSHGYPNNDLQMITVYRAKELCSCLFVIQQTEDHCINWTVANPNITSFDIDAENKSVRSQALMFWHAKADFIDDKTGCRIVESTLD